MLAPVPINLSSQEGLIALLRNLFKDNDKKLSIEDLANNEINIKPMDLVVAENGNTYLKTEITSTDIYPFKKLIPNLPLRNAICSKSLRKALLLPIKITETEKDEIKRNFFCPILRDATFMPVITPLGQHYDSHEIHRSLTKVDTRDPNTNEDLFKDQLIPNSSLQQLLMLYAQKDKSILKILAEYMKDLSDEEKREAVIIPTKLAALICAPIIMPLLDIITFIIRPSSRSIFFNKEVLRSDMGIVVGCCLLYLLIFTAIKNRLQEEVKEQSLSEDLTYSKTTLLKLKEKVINPLLASPFLDKETKKMLMNSDNNAGSKEPPEKISLNSPHIPRM